MYQHCSAIDIIKYLYLYDFESSSAGLAILYTTPVNYVSLNNHRTEIFDVDCSISSLCFFELTKGFRYKSRVEMTK